MFRHSAMPESPTRSSAGVAPAGSVLLHKAALPSPGTETSGSSATDRPQRFAGSHAKSHRSRSISRRDSPPQALRGPEGLTFELPQRVPVDRKSPLQWPAIQSAALSGTTSASYAPTRPVHNPCIQTVSLDDAEASPRSWGIAESDRPCSLGTRASHPKHTRVQRPELFGGTDSTPIRSSLIPSEIPEGTRFRTQPVCQRHKTNAGPPGDNAAGPHRSGAGPVRSPPAQGPAVAGRVRGRVHPPIRTSTDWFLSFRSWRHWMVRYTGP